MNLERIFKMAKKNVTQEEFDVESLLIKIEKLEKKKILN